MNDQEMDLLRERVRWLNRLGDLDGLVEMMQALREEIRTLMGYLDHPAALDKVTLNVVALLGDIPIAVDPGRMSEALGYEDLCLSGIATRYEKVATLIAGLRMVVDEADEYFASLRRQAASAEIAAVEAEDDAQEASDGGPAA